MSTRIADYNLLFGILAMQMDFISRDALVAAMNSWMLHKSKPLGQILIEQGKLAEDSKALLDALVAKHVSMHDGDAGKSLAAVSSIASVREDLSQLADPDIDVSLQNVSVADDVNDPYLTLDTSVGASTSSGLRFRILRPHAKGGLGQVYLAVDAELHREVALKEIQSAHADDLNTRSRFVFEAEITGNLEHPGIVPVYGLGQYADGRPYYAMRFIRGDSLKDAIQAYHSASTQMKPDPAVQALELRKLLGRFIDVCDAIGYAHSRGVLHRDLKPGNIMLGKYGETLVVDWGLAKSVDQASHPKQSVERSLHPVSASGSAGTMFGSVVGTPAFMSPEQASGNLEQLGPASDVYSLGATLYCLLTGKAPFNDKDVGVILQKVQQGDFPKPRQANAAVNPTLEAICLKAMSLKPDDRYAAPRELASDLEHWLADEPVGVYREPISHRISRWGRRHKTVVAGVGALLFTTVIGLSVGTWLISREQSRTVTALKQVEEAQYDRALAQVDSLLTAEPASVPMLLSSLEPDRDDVLPRLRELDQQLDLSEKQRVRVSLALLPLEPERVRFLRDWMLKTDPEELLVVRQMLLPYKPQLTEELWQVASNADSHRDQRLRAACALAAFDTGSSRWPGISDFIADALVSQNPLYLSAWMTALQPIRGSLVEPLSKLFREREKFEEKYLLANILANYAADDVKLLAELIQDADKSQYGVILENLKPHGELAITALNSQLDQQIALDWGDAVPNRSFEPPPLSVVEQIESAKGLVADQFVMVQTLPLASFSAVAEELRKCGYRPCRVRPFFTDKGVSTAAIWKRDGREWQFMAAGTVDEARAQEASWRDQGFIVEDVAGYHTESTEGVSPRYALIAMKREGELERKTYIGLTDDEDAEAQEPFTQDTNNFALLVEQELIDKAGESTYSSIWSRLPYSASWQDIAAAHELLVDSLSSPSRLPTDVSLNQSPQPPERYNPYELDTSESGELERSLAEPLLRGAENVGFGNNEDAIVDLNTAISRMPLLPQGYGLRAIAHARLGHREQAIQDLALCQKFTEQTIDYSSSNDERIETKTLLEYSTAVASTYLGQSETAMDRMEVFVSQYPQSPKVLFAATLAFAVAADQSVTEPQTELDKSARYSERAIELLQEAVVCGFENREWEIQTNPDLAKLREQPGFDKVVEPMHLERRYTCAWFRGTMAQESKRVLAVPTDDHLAKSKELAERGYRPFSLSAAAIGDGQLYCTSIWFRPVPSSDALNSLARRQANAAFTLMQLGSDPDRVWTLMQQATDPRLRTYLIQRIAELQLDAGALLNRYQVETNVSARRAILLALGSYDIENVEAGVRDSFVNDLLTAYRVEPDPGAHSAMEWLLRQWGYASEVQQADQQLTTKLPISNRDWFINRQEETMAIVRGPVEFAMGSPLHENPRDFDEVIHRQRINRTYAIATKEITVKQFLRFRPDAQYRAGFSAGQETPMIDCNWFEALQYCRWLSEQEGIEEDQMCYPPIDQIGPNMVLPLNYLERTGYRLPTEAEFEYACRAGTQTAYYFGDDEKILPEYARSLSNSSNQASPVGELKPNDFGLFDASGNVGEWCQSPYAEYTCLPMGKPLEDTSTPEFGSVVRSGSWLSENYGVRCAKRFNIEPTERAQDVGFRVARTLAK